MPVTDAGADPDTMAEYGAELGGTMKKQLAFPVDEYASRMKGVRAAMADKKVDGILVNWPEHIYYLTGYHSQGFFAFQTMLVLPEGEPKLLTRTIERTNVIPLSWLEESLTYNDDEDPYLRVGEMIRSAGLAKSRIGIERNCFYLTSLGYERLSAILPDVKWVDTSDLVGRLMVVKSELEIECLRRAGRIAQEAMKSGMAAVRIGGSENQVAAEIYRAMVLAGSEYTGFAPFVTSGPRTAQSHATWSGRQLKRGDLVRIEVAGCVNRYHAVQMRCAVLGQPSPRLREWVAVCRKALDRTVATVRPGASTGDVHHACESIIAEAGWGQYYKRRTGHSIGVGFPPAWSTGYVMSVQRGATELLEPGMAFHVIPGIQVPGEEYFALDATVLVTKDGSEVLTPFDRDLVIVD
jgi:Xaa-Pro dipeptidase